MDELRGFNAPRLYEKLLMTSDEDFESWLKELGLLYKERTCECGGGMNFKWKEDRKYPDWRCTKKNCRKEKGYLVGTWFEGTHLTLKEVFQLSYFWCRQTHTRDEAMFDMRRNDGSSIGSHALSDWNNFYREVRSFD